jgi:hypothetical protein
MCQRPNRPPAHHARQRRLAPVHERSGRMIRIAIPSAALRAPRLLPADTCPRCRGQRTGISWARECPPPVHSPRGARGGLITERLLTRTSRRTRAACMAFRDDGWHRSCCVDARGSRRRFPRSVHDHIGTGDGVSGPGRCSDRRPPIRSCADRQASRHDRCPAHGRAPARSRREKSARAGDDDQVRVRSPVNAGSGTARAVRGGFSPRTRAVRSGTVTRKMRG